MKTTLTLTFPWKTKIEDIKSFERNGVTYIPMTGNRVDPDLAERRQRYNDINPGYWNAEMLHAGYHVTFYPSDSKLVAALGR